MKIQFGTTTPWAACRSLLLPYAGDLFMVFSLSLLQPSNQCHKSDVQSYMSNLTSSIEDNSFCDIHYEKCLCSVLLNTTNNSENCITNIELQYSRILPLLSFILQICVLRDLFTLSVDFNRKYIYIAWILCFFTLIGLGIGISWSSCYQFKISAAIVFVWFPVGLLGTHNFFSVQKREEAHSQTWNRSRFLQTDAPADRPVTSTDSISDPQYDMFYIPAYRSERNRN